MHQREGLIQGILLECHGAERCPWIPCPYLHTLTLIARILAVPVLELPWYPSVSYPAPWPSPHVQVGPVWVETCDQVIAIYAKLKEIENVKYIL